MCDEQIEVDDDIVYNMDDEIVHERCLSSDPLVLKHAVPRVCNSCWMVHAGECF